MAVSQKMPGALLAFSAEGFCAGASAVCLTLGGLAVFLYGMTVLSESLRALAGSRMKKLLAKATAGPVAGICAGAGVTALLQSSSATTVMLVGFADAGLLTAAQAASVVMGANIGTTITLQLVSLRAFSVLAAVCLAAGAGLLLRLLGRTERARLAGTALVALGMIFIGLEFMSDSMRTFRDSRTFRLLFRTLDSPVLLLLTGLLFTAVIQSSLAATTVLAGFVAAGEAGAGMSLGGALFAVLGINIGTCVTAVLSAVGAGTEAKRTACMHVLFNTLGALFMFFFLLAAGKSGWFLDMLSLGAMRADGAADPLRQLANFHTLFNVVTTLLLLPFLRALTGLCRRIVPEKEARGTGNRSGSGYFRRLRRK